MQKVQQGQPLTYNQLASPGILCWWALTRANNSFIYFTPVLTKSSALKQLQKSPLLSVTPVWWWNTEWCRSYWQKLIPAKRFCNKNPSLVNHPHYKAPLESSDDTNQLQQSRHSWPQCFHPEHLHNFVSLAVFKQTMQWDGNQFVNIRWEAYIFVEFMCLFTQRKIIK